MIDFLKRTTEPIFYVTPDPARAIGLEKVLPNYHIVCLDDSPLVSLLEKSGVKVFSLERKLGQKKTILRNSGMILAYPLVQEYIVQNSQEQRPNILFFKPSKKIEAVAKRKGYRLLGNSANLNELFEDKISFYKLCQDWNLPVPSGEIEILKRADFERLAVKFGKKLVVQFGHGWAGETTFFIEKKEDLDKLKSQFPEREVCITSFVAGKTFVNNVCITTRDILISSPAIQIDAPGGFAAKKGATCGRQWPALLDFKTEARIKEYSEIIGEKMKKAGYLGYFGLDFLLEEKTGKLFLSENNARLTASVPLYTKMELKNNQLPLLVFHILAFLGKDHELGYSSLQLSGGELLIRNNQPAPILIKNNFPIGIYQFNDDNLIGIRDGYSFEDVTDQPEFLLNAPQKGRIISPNDEIAKISAEKILDDQGKVQSHLVMALIEVKRKLVS